MRRLQKQTLLEFVGYFFKTSLQISFSYDTDKSACNVSRHTRTTTDNSQILTRDGAAAAEEDEIWRELCLCNASVLSTETENY